MMNRVEVRLAEIRRRSQVLLARRKQRRKCILAGCMALLLCGGFCASLSVPDRKIGGISNNGSYHDAGDVLYGGITVGGTAEVTGTGISRRYSAAEDVRALMDIFEKVQISDNSALTPESQESTQETDGYTITVTDREGVQTEYLLRKGLLTNCTTGGTFSVPELELSELMRLLGISND